MKHVVQAWQAGMCMQLIDYCITKMLKSLNFQRIAPSTGCFCFHLVVDGFASHLDAMNMNWREEARRLRGVAGTSSRQIIQNIVKTNMLFFTSLTRDQEAKLHLISVVCNFMLCGLFTKYEQKYHISVSAFVG